MTETPFADALLDGWALAAALHGEADRARAATVPVLADALESRLGALKDPATKVASLRAWAARTRPTVDPARVRRVPARARTLLATLDGAAPSGPLPALRPGYRAAPGLAWSLARQAARLAPSDADRGRGRELLAAHPERGERLLRQGAEAEAVEQLGRLQGAEPVEGPAELSWALVAAEGHRDPVAELGRLVGVRGGRGGAEIRELAVALPLEEPCPE